MVQLVQNRKPKELEALTPEAGIDTEQLDTERLPEPKLEKAAPPTEAELDDIILNGAGSTTSISVQAPHTARSNIESAPQTTELSSDLRSLLTDRILKNEKTKAIVEALGGVKNLTDEKLSELNRLASRPEVIDKVLEFANKDISQIAKDSGYDKQELLKKLDKSPSKPNKDYNIGGRDNCTAGGALGALLIEKPEAYAEKVIELFTSENASIDTGFTDANGQAVKISLSRSALKDAPTDLVGGMKPADMLELGMQASYMDAAVKSAWNVHLDSDKGKAWLAKWREDNPEKAKQLPSGQQPFYNPRIDKVVYPDGTEFSGLNREEDHAMEILVHGGAKRLDMHQLVQNSNVRDLFDQSPLTRERLNEISNKLNSEESLTVLGISASEREELKGFLDLVNTAIEKGESGEPQTFGAVVYYKSGHLVDKGSLHKIMVQVEDEGESGIQVKFYNTWGKTESDFDKHPFTGAEKTEGNTYKCSLKDFIQNARLDHVMDTVTDAGLTTKEVEKDNASDVDTWGRFYGEPGEVIIHGERITMPWELKTGIEKKKKPNLDDLKKKDKSLNEPVKATTEDLTENIAVTKRATPEELAQARRSARTRANNPVAPALNPVAPSGGNPIL